MARAGLPFRASLRTYLLLLIVGGMLPFLVISGALLVEVIKDNRAAVERRLLEAARTQAATVDREMMTTVRALEAIAASEALTNGDLRGFDADARRLVLTQPAWYAIILLAPDGRVLSDTSRATDDALSTAVDPASLNIAVRTGRPSVGDLRRGPDERLAFAVRVPMKQNGQVRYVLTAVMTPESLNGIVAREFIDSDEWTRTIVDRSGTIVARTRNPERFVGQSVTASAFDRLSNNHELTSRDRTVDGEMVYGTFSHSSLSGWSSSVTIPVAVVERPFRQSLTLLMLVAAALVSVGTAGAYLLAAAISAEIKSATEAADTLALGKGLANDASRLHEISHLRESLDRSASLLAARQQERDEHLARAESARAEAESANRTKDEFLAMLGHELRNPLSPIVTALHLVKARGSEWTREHAVIERQVQHMIRLVGDLLDVSRITRGKIELHREVVPLESVVTRAMEMTAPVFEARRHIVHTAVPDGIFVNGDPVRLAQIFANLFSNAAAYTPAGGEVSISATRSGGDVRVAVTDNGRGLSPELLPRIFDLFVQGPRSIERREGGLGLGLAIASSLAKLHRGRIEAYSDGTDRGSTFVVYLPEVPPESPAPKAADRTTVEAPRQLRLLVVDDNRDAAQMLEELFRDRGHLTMTAANGHDALDILDGFKPDIAVLDIGLPIMDGYELASRIRAKLGSSTPILIALTGYGQPEDLRRSRDAGFARHLVKPVDGDELLDLITEVVS
jgi:signal transduction histidine kinase